MHKIVGVQLKMSCVVGLRSKKDKDVDTLGCQQVSNGFGQGAATKHLCRGCQRLNTIWNNGERCCRTTPSRAANAGILSPSSTHCYWRELTHIRPDIIVHEWLRRTIKKGCTIMQWVDSVAIILSQTFSGVGTTRAEESGLKPDMTIPLEAWRAHYTNLNI